METIFLGVNLLNVFCEVTSYSPNKPLQQTFDLFLLINYFCGDFIL
jgi:hypothetical protein